VTTAELIARSVCYLTRWRSNPSSIEGATARLHGASCRFCSVPLEELATSIKGRGDDQADFERLGREARFARIREALDGGWWEGLPG